MRLPLFSKTRKKLIFVLPVHALLDRLVEHEEEICATCEALSELDWCVRCASKRL